MQENITDRIVKRISEMSINGRRVADIRAKRCCDCYVGEPERLFGEIQHRYEWDQLRTEDEKTYQRLSALISSWGVAIRVDNMKLFKNVKTRIGVVDICDKTRLLTSGSRASYVLCYQVVQENLHLLGVRRRTLFKYETYRLMYLDENFERILTVLVKTPHAIPEESLLEEEEKEKGV